MRNKTFLLLIFFLSGTAASFASIPTDRPQRGVHVGMTEGDFLPFYPFRTARNFRHVGPEDWLTYEMPANATYRLITFYFLNNKLNQWSFDDRPEVVKEYLAEFCFYQDPNLTYQALREVLTRMPYKDFLSA